MSVDETLIHLDNVTKVFVTDEVETHALAGIHIDIKTRRVRLHLGAVGLRKIYSAGHSRPAGFAERRHVCTQ